MTDGSANILNAAGDKLQRLEEHWSAVFSAKEYSEAAADNWFHRAYPDGKGLKDFPSRQPDPWTVRKSDVRKAICMANRSASSPDGVPYKVWKLLCETLRT